MNKELHKLTSDAEGEEMLTVSRKRVQEIYKDSKQIVSNETYGSKKYAMHIQTLCVLEALFGSKCLPDNVDSSEPKPDEPKFKVGDMVRYVGDMQPTCKGKAFVMDGEVFFNDYYNQWQTRSIKPFAWDGLSVCNVPLTDLEPYTEPTKEADKQFDTMLKDSFSKERRLNIAAMVIASIMGSNDWTEYRGGTNEDVWRNMAKASLGVADALLVEAEKGGTGCIS